MPAVYRHTQGPTTVLLWAITESEEQLISLVSPHDRASAERFRSSPRRREHLAWRAALRQIVGEGEVGYDDAGAPYIKEAGGMPYIKCDGAQTPYLQHDDTGAPYDIIPDDRGAHSLKDKRTPGGKMQNIFISAAHTRGMAAVIVSDGPCAIDTESVTRNLGRTASRFISPAELALPTNNDPAFPVMIWCAKEALYKYSGRRELDFLNDLEITASDPETGEMTGRIAETHGIRLNVLRFNEYIAVYIKP